MRISRLDTIPSQPDAALAANRGVPKSFVGFGLVGCAIGFFVGSIVLWGYSTGYEPAWRWSPTLPATHPFTALCLIALALSFSPASPRMPYMRKLTDTMLAVAIGLLLVRLSAPVFGWMLFDAFTPFRDSLIAHFVAGKTQIDMPVNVTVALLLLAMGQALHRIHRPVASQASACGAVVVLFLGVTGFLGRLSGFWGTVGPSTLVGIAGLTAAVLFATVRHGFMRAITAPSEPGRLARLLLGGCTAILVLIGWVVSRRIDGPGIPLPADGHLLVYEMAAVTALFWMLIAISTLRADRVDRYRVVAERLLQRTSTRDALTGLLTRNRMAQLRAARGRERLPSASLFIDLDRFRSVNEALGSEEGDRILKEVARRLLELAGDGLVARIGGDEFAIFNVNMTPAQAKHLGAATLVALAQPFAIGGRNFRLTASIGIAHTDAAGSIDLRQAADDAAYVAKSRGGNQAVVFTSTMHDARRQEAELEQDLHEAMRRDDELSLFYQPVISTLDGKLLAAEALARWTHPRLGMVAPDRFIAMAERTGLMVPLGLKLMEMGVAQAAKWEAARPGQCPLLNLNVSPVQFGSGDVVGDLVAMIRRHGLAPERFAIEVTESVFATPEAIRGLTRARAYGFKVSMDDFGVGYSTLSQLPRLPLTSVKLDRSFIVHATETTGDAVVFGAITHLVHALGLLVVAEGVEDQAQFDLIADSGCEAVQGYFIARPAPAHLFEQWMENSEPGRIKRPVGALAL